MLEQGLAMFGFGLVVGFIIGVIYMNMYCQDAMHLYNKHKYLYPKNNHLYTKISEVRCKDVTTGNWYDAVLYTDGKGVYVREKKDFEAKFQQQ